MLVLSTRRPLLFACGEDKSGNLSLLFAAETELKDKMARASGGSEYGDEPLNYDDQNSESEESEYSEPDDTQSTTGENGETDVKADGAVTLNINIGSNGFRVSPSLSNVQTSPRKSTSASASASSSGVIRIMDLESVGPNMRMFYSSPWWTSMAKTGTSLDPISRIA